MKRNSNLAAAC